MSEEPIEINVWKPLHITKDDGDYSVKVPERRPVLFKNADIPGCYHLGMIVDGNFHEFDSRNQLYKRRHDFSMWNAWGKSFAFPRFSPTHFMMLE